MNYNRRTRIVARCSNSLAGYSLAAKVDARLNNET